MSKNKILSLTVAEFIVQSDVLTLLVKLPFRITVLTSWSCLGFVLHDVMVNAKRATNTINVMYDLNI